MAKKQDDELDQLEEVIRKLKNKYDQFFTGILKVPPMMERRNVEVMIFEIGKQKMRDNTRRFRYNQLLSRYNQYRELWGRRMREREEGPMEFQRRKAALAEPMSEPTHHTQPQSRVTSNGDDAYVRVTPDSNGVEVGKLYEQIESAHQQAGSRPTVTLEQLGQMVQKQSEMIREKYKVTKVAFRVETVDGKVKLKAKPVQD